MSPSNQDQTGTQSSQFGITTHTQPGVFLSAVEFPYDQLGTSTDAQKELKSF